MASGSERQHMDITETSRRIYYQNLVYHACNVIDRILGGHRTVCGTLDTPVRDFEDRLNMVETMVVATRAENARLRAWVADLQSGMYVNCVYCGYRYGPKTTTPVSLADVLKEHVEKCPKHPMSALKHELELMKVERDEMHFFCHDVCRRR
jgi:hypothetical protein